MGANHLSPETPLAYAGIKALAKQLRGPASTLYALSENSDPFYITPSRQTAAQWFKAEVWDLIDPSRGVHLRRLQDEQLFQSERSYIEQIGFYKGYQGKPTARRRLNGNGGAAP